MTLHYPEGIDCVWMSVDKNGHLAAFVTGGEGPIPVDILNQNAVPIEEIESAICELEVRSEAKLLVSLPRPDDFIDMARRGIYVFDWQDVSRTRGDRTGLYEKIAVPTEPITLDGLPNQLRALVENAICTAIDFGEVSSVKAQAQFDCRIAD